MRHFPHSTRFWLTVLLFVISLAALAPAQAAPAGTPVATVRTARGEVWSRPKGKSQFMALASRQALYAGDVVGTGANGRLALLFNDGAQLRLNHNSAVEITPPEKTAGKASLFRALNGEVWARLRPGNKVRTRTVALGVRGTEILLQVAGEDGTTTLTVVEGEVEFGNEYGQVIVKTAQNSIARPGQAPTQPLTVQNPGLIIEWTLDLENAALSREKLFDGAVRGDAQFNNRRFVEALAEYQTADAIAPTATLKNRIGWALLELDRTADAQTQFRAAGAVGLVGMAWLEITRWQPATAEKLAAQAIGGAGELPALLNEARTALGIAQLRQGKIAEAAISLSSAAKEVSSTQFQAQSWLALALLAQNDAVNALQAAKTAVHLQPKSALTQGNLALVLLFTNQLQEAARAARVATALNPESSAAQIVLSQTLLARGEADKAAHAAARAVALDPQAPQAFYLLGVADAARRDYRHAERELHTALRLAPDFLPAATALARVYNAMDRPQQAVAGLSDLLPRERNGEVSGALGEVFYEQGNYVQSAARFREAIAKSPQSALFHDGLARTLLYSNRLSAAIAAAQTAVRLAPETGQYHATLGLAYDFSRFTSQAEREFRTALAYDPQNALALTQLALKQAGTDLRPVASSFTQGFLYDPAVARRLFRGGVHAEVTPFAGTEGTRGTELFHRATASEGRLNDFGFATYNSQNGTRANEESDVLDVAQFLTYVPGPRTNFYTTLRLQNVKRGLGGSLAAPDFDDRSRFRFGEAQLAARQRFGRGFLWAGLRGNTSRNTTIDPGLNSFLDPFSQLPVSRQRFDSQALVPELRFDLVTGETPQRSGLLTFGLSHASTNFDTRRDLRVPVGNGRASGRFDEDDSVTSGYAQWSGRLNERLSLSAQLRAQHDRRVRAALVTVPGQPILQGNERRKRTNLLPGLLATYRMDGRTALRFSYNDRLTDVTSATFAPTETLLTTQPAALPFGTPDRLQLAQMEIERYIGARDFVKAFAFRTSARDVIIGGADLLGFGSGLPAPNAPFLNMARWQAHGAGARYERQLNTSWFAAAGFALRHSEANGTNEAPYEPRRLATLELNYLTPGGTKAALRLRHNGAFFQDSPAIIGRPQFRAQNYVDLLLAREPSLRGEFFLNVTNLFNRAELRFNSFPAEGRRVQAGYTRRF